MAQEISSNNTGMYVFIEALSRSNFCRGKAIGVTYFSARARVRVYARAWVGVCARGRAHVGARV